MRTHLGITRVAIVGVCLGALLTGAAFAQRPSHLLGGPLHVTVRQTIGEIRIASDDYPSEDQAAGTVDLVNGRLLHGTNHAEMGHIRVPHNLDVDPFPGSCPYHSDCLEGLAAAPALEARWGQPPHLLPSQHPAWELEAHYLALGIANWTCTLSPERIILGGGVLRRAEILTAIRCKVPELINGYIDCPDIVLPGLGSRAGVLGGIALAALEAN